MSPETIRRAYECARQSWFAAGQPMDRAKSPLRRRYVRLYNMLADLRAADRRPVFLVLPCDFYGRPGWSYKGFTGETPREAVHEAALSGEASIDDAFGPARFVDRTTGRDIPEPTTPRN